MDILPEKFFYNIYIYTQMYSHYYQMNDDAVVYVVALAVSSGRGGCGGTSILVTSCRHNE